MEQALVSGMTAAFQAGRAERHPTNNLYEEEM
jgi:hypothetical protein